MFRSSSIEPPFLLEFPYLFPMGIMMFVPIFLALLGQGSRGVEAQNGGSLR
jgi:hypothetical protein